MVLVPPCTQSGYTQSYPAGAHHLLVHLVDVAVRGIRWQSQESERRAFLKALTIRNVARGPGSMVSMEATGEALKHRFCQLAVLGRFVAKPIELSVALSS